MSISKIAMLTFGMAILTSSTFLGQQAFAGVTCPPGYIYDGSNECIKIPEVGGLAVPISESEVFGELAKQYSLWLIPSISAIGIAAFVIKRKL